MVSWVHNFDDEPILFYSELDEKRNEIRKIEIYRDESFGLASLSFEFGGAGLSLEPVPSFEEIKEDPQFLPKVISKDEFEQIWAEYLNFLDSRS